MRILFLALTLLLHIVLTLTLSSSTYFYWLIGMMLLTLVAGFLLKRKGASLYIKNLGWGLFYGSIIAVSILAIVVVALLVMFNGVTC